MTRVSRRHFVHGAGPVALALLSACAASGRRPPRIGLVLPADEADPNLEAFRQGLREHGYVEGQNLLVEWRFAEGQPQRVPELIEELVRLPVDVLVTPSEAVAR